MYNLITRMATFTLYSIFTLESCQELNGSHLSCFTSTFEKPLLDFIKKKKTETVPQ